MWGPPEVAQSANEQTFVYTNAAPQASVFNQSKRCGPGWRTTCWTTPAPTGSGCVFTGPVLAADDPPYRGVQIPRLFYKIAAWATTEAGSTDVSLAATGYVLDQTPELPDVQAATTRALLAGEPPPLGPYRTYQVPIADIATLTGLDLGPLVAADRLPAPVPLPAGALVPATAAALGRWQRLDSASDIQL